MRRIKVRDLRKDLSEHLGNLPFIITKHGEDLAVVKKIDSYINVDEPEGVLEDKPRKTCTHGYPVELCRKCKKK